jgi:hypothetical protein
MMMISGFALLGVCADQTASAARTDSVENPVTIVKLKGGPQASRVVRGVICEGYDNVWHHWVENQGLKALNVEVYEGLAANGVLLSSTLIVFADQGAFPTGVVQLPDFLPTHAQLYNLVFTPMGHKGAQALYYHEVAAKYAPVPQVEVAYEPGMFSVDASTSYDPDGWIVSFEWHWSDGALDIGPTSSHWYMQGEFLSVTLVITDNDGLEGMMIIYAGWW